MSDDKKMIEYKVATFDDESDYFDNVKLELDYSISITEGAMELGRDKIKNRRSTCVTVTEIWMTRNSSRICSL